MPEFRGNSCRPSSRYFTQTVSVKTPAVKMRASGGVCLFPSFWPKACMAEAECVHMCLCVKMCMCYWICDTVTPLFWESMAM